MNNKPKDTGSSLVHRSNIKKTSKMESKNFAKIIGTRYKDYLVKKVNNNDDLGVMVTTVSENVETSITISVEKEADINPLYENITFLNVETEFHERNLFGLESKESGTEEE